MLYLPSLAIGTLSRHSDNLVMKHTTERSCRENVIAPCPEIPEKIENVEERLLKYGTSAKSMKMLSQRNLIGSTLPRFFADFVSGRQKVSVTILAKGFRKKLQTSKNVNAWWERPQLRSEPRAELESVPILQA